MKKVSLLLCLVFSLALWSQTGAQDEATVPAVAETTPSRNDGASDPAIWLHPEDLSLSLIIGADDEGALAVYDLSGAELSAIEGEAFAAVDLRYNVNGGALVAAGIDEDTRILFYTVDADSRELQALGEIETGVELATMCLYQSAVDDSLYLFASDEGGDYQQWRLTVDEAISGELVREFSQGGEVESCVADDELGVLYIAEGETAIWRYGAEPESDLGRAMVDAVGMNISEEVEGLAIYYGANGAGYLIASNQASNNFNVYTREDNEFVGTFSITAGAGVDEVTEAGGIEVVNLPLNDQFPGGLFVAADDSNTDPDESTNFKLASWAEIAEALGLELDTENDPRSSAAGGGTPQIPASAETVPVPTGRDAADDPAIWIHPSDPALSTIIGTDKNGGLVVYNLDGSELQFLPVGRMNNVDLRYNFPLAGMEARAVVVASNRTDDTLSIFTVNPETRLLEEAAARSISGELPEVYGLCLYYGEGGKFYVFVNSTNTGAVSQFELIPAPEGKIDAQLVRQFTVGTQTEGCVADDFYGALYIGEEGYGIWKYAAEPNGGDGRVLVDSIESGQLTADVEGMSLYTMASGEGYLVVSSQGNSSFAVYERTGENAYVGSFGIRAGEIADAVSGTDGLDLTNFPLGPDYPNGLFVAQDDNNIDPAANQSFKLVDWGLVAEALGLTLDTEFDPRQVGR